MGWNLLRESQIGAPRLFSGLVDAIPEIAARATPTWHRSRGSADVPTKEMHMQKIVSPPPCSEVEGLRALQGSAFGRRAQERKVFQGFRDQFEETPALSPSYSRLIC